MPRVEREPILLPQSEIPVLPDGGTPKRTPEKDFRLPVILILKDTERNRRMDNLPKLAGAEIKYGPEGDIYYATWRERKFVRKPELYVSKSRLPERWTLQRMLKTAIRKPISEIVYHQVRKDKGSVEAAIRSVNYIRREYRVVGGEEIEEVRKLRKQIDQALDVLRQYPSRISPKEFDEGFDQLHQQTKEVLKNLRMEKVILQLKRELTSQVARGTRGKDRLERRNPQAMLKILDSAQRKAEMRMETIRFIRTKYSAIDVALKDERRKSRQIFKEVKKHMGMRGLSGHGVFRKPEKGTTPRQRGILLGRLGSLIRQLRQIKLKPYKPVAQELIEELKHARDLLKEERYKEAKEIFLNARPKTEEVLEDPRYRRIYPKKNEQ